MWKRAHLYIFRARVRPHPRPLPLPSIFPSSRRPLPDMLFGFFACSSSASCAMRQATRASHDVHQRGIDRAYATQDGEEGRGAGAGAGAEEGEQHMCH
jgi:hypothetical protein